MCVPTKLSIVAIQFFLISQILCYLMTASCEKMDIVQFFYQIKIVLVSMPKTVISQQKYFSLKIFCVEWAKYFLFA